MSYRSQTEAALKTYLEGKVGVPVYAGTSDQVKEMPCVIVSYMGGTENPPRSGNMDVNLEIGIHGEIGEDAQPGALATHNELVDNVEESLFFENLININTAANDFHLFDIVEHTGIERDTEGTTLRETINITLATALGDF